jgi:flagellar hook assembly protein FlgD
VWDVQGRIVRRLQQSQLPAGVHVLRWDGKLDSGSSAASGVYWIRVTSGKIDKKVKLVIVR